MSYARPFDNDRAGDLRERSTTGASHLLRAPLGIDVEDLRPLAPLLCVHSLGVWATNDHVSPASWL